MVRCRVRSLGCALLLGFALASLGAAQVADTVPGRLTDVEFWRLSEAMSEPNGYFRTDNLLSNELYYPEVIPALIERAASGGIYLGVGPEQNFNYIVALRPRMAFITDVRRGNLHAQLMYKALFELSGDRADFYSKLFTKPRPAGLTAQATAMQIVNAFAEQPTSGQAAYEQNIRAIQDHLTRTRALPLSAEDLEGIAYIYSNFYWFGPSITYNSSGSNGGRGSSMATYGQLMVAEDINGIGRSYLASEDSFRFMKELEGRNMVVPVVGNFGGSKSLRAVGQYVRDHGATVSAFYLSNVEQYLRQDGIWGQFCANVATMPLTSGSTFIRSQSGGGGGFRNMLGPMQAETEPCGIAAGR